MLRPGRSLALLAVLIGVIVGSWALITPEGGGPDEPGHLVRAGGVARGQVGDDEMFEVTDHYLLPEVTCWIFQPTVPASCAGPRATTGATIDIPSTASDYPIWSHLVAGAASRLPGDAPLWWARAANAGVATLLVAAALWAVRYDRFAAAGVLVALTPMAWFSMAIVNPSSMAIAGAVALWVGLVHRPDQDWLVAAGWAALALPRRDGLVWAALALVVGLAVTDRRASEWWRSLRRGPRVVIAAATVAAVAWGVASESNASRFVVAAPLAVAAAELVGAGWRRARSPWERGAIGAAALVAAGAGAAVVVLLRPGGWDGDLAGDVVGETGANLVEAVGRLGWLDTPLPWLVVVGWVAAVGVMAGGGLADRGDRTVAAGALLAATIVTAWIFELLQGGTTGTYWQGRYSLPILVGIPIVLGAARLRPAREHAVASAVVVGVLALDNVALAAAARRFGVGVDGSLSPWDWDTYRAPVAPVVTIGVHLVATAALAWFLVGAGRRPVTI